MKGVERFVCDRNGELQNDELIAEEPLEIRISGETLAVTMRTPGDDLELVLGFLHGEGVIAFSGDVSSITHCAKDPNDEESKKNTMEVVLAPGVTPPIDPESGMFAKRGTLTSSACGVCGRRAIEDLLARVEPLTTEVNVPHEVVVETVRALKQRQPLFRATGACHAASLTTLTGVHIATYEDVGRHNAVDKAIGHCLRVDALPLSNHMLVVSGRCSFEIVQKAVMARIPVIAAVSAATSLAVKLAKASNITLAGFVRDDAMTVYAGVAIAR